MQLLRKAAFKEAKQKELAMVTPNNSQRISGGQRDVATSQSEMTGASKTLTVNLCKKSGRIKSCFSCGLTAKFIKDCTYPMQPGKGKETLRSNSAATVVTIYKEIKMIMERITVLQIELKENLVVAM